MFSRMTLATITTAVSHKAANGSEILALEAKRPSFIFNMNVSASRHRKQHQLTILSTSINTRMSPSHHYHCLF